MEEIQAKTGKDGEPITVDYDMPEDLAGMQAKFGDEAVYDAARGNFRIAIQSVMRSYMKPGPNGQLMGQAQIQEIVSGWNPGTKARGKTTAEKASMLLSQLTPEEMNEIMSRWADSEGD